MSQHEENLFALFAGRRKRASPTPIAAAPLQPQAENRPLPTAQQSSVIHLVDSDTDDGPATDSRQRPGEDLHAVAGVSQRTKRAMSCSADSSDDDLALLVPHNPPAKIPRAAQRPQEERLDALSWGTKKGRRQCITKLEHALATQLLQDPGVLVTFAPFMTSRAIRDIEGSQHAITFAEPKLQRPVSSILGDMTLREYQCDGVQYLLGNFARGFSTILADDMGLGKTAQIASFLNTLKKLVGMSGPHVIVCPVSTAAGWARELGRWAPLLRVVRYHGSQRHHHQHIVNAVFIVSPSTLLNDRAFFLKRCWQVAVFDEAHALRGKTSAISDVMARFDAAFRIAVTGTPVSVSASEVWRIMRFLYPAFGRKLAAPDENDQESMKAQCSAILKILMLRRTKDTLNLGLPPKQELPVTQIDMPSSQKQLYRFLLSEVGRSASRDVDGLGSVLMNLRRVCCHPWLFRLHLFRDVGPSTAAAPGLHRLKQASVPLTEDALISSSGKMIVLDQLLAKRKADGNRVLIFSNFTSQLDIIEGLCSLRNYTYDRLDGSSTRTEREVLMARFNPPNSQVFCLLISTTAGGVGITLTGADTVIIYDAHFNPQLDRQAADRAHRLGQTRPVTVHRLSVKDTIDERIVRRASARAVMGDIIVDGTGDSERDITSELMQEIHNASSMIAADDEAVHNGGGFLQQLQTSPSGFMLPGSEVTGVPQMQELPTTPCFSCSGSEGHRLACPGCHKAYHPACATGRTAANAAMWRCSRHRCAECGLRATEDTLFMCTECPASYCYDCLDADYFSMVGSTDGLTLPHVSATYPDMDADGMVRQRGVFYIRCGACGGVGGVESDDDDSSTISWQSSEDAL